MRDRPSEAQSAMEGAAAASTECPECGAALLHTDGCVLCAECGYSPCD